MNGEKNGKAKEYDYNGKLIFEGEYLKDKRYENGKEYSFGKLMFEGEYLNGEKWNGIQFLYTKNVKYTNNFINGKKI